MTAINLGQALALWIDATPPTNTRMLWFDTTITGSGSPIKYFDTITNTWEFLQGSGNLARRSAITEEETFINIPDQGTTDYEVETIIYRTTSGANGFLIAEISDKAHTSFKLTVPTGYETGTFVYRILKF